MITTFVGGGNMAAALIGGMLQGGFRADQIRVAETDAERARALRAMYPIEVHDALGGWAAPSDIVVLAVKPDQARAASAAIAAHLGGGLVLSIAAGVRATTLARWLGTANVVRAMPNTPALIRRGISAAAALPAVSTQGRADAECVLRAVGEVVWLDDEALLDPVTAVSGSGPAYVLLFAEALQRAGVDLGLSSEQARQLALHTFAGAAQLALASGDPLDVLRARVTSKGGTTAAALASLAADRVEAAIVRAVDAANKRAREMGDELDRADDGQRNA